MIDIDCIKRYLRSQQERICNTLIQMDKTLELKEDNWVRESGGGGRSRVMQKGNIFEQAGINF